MKKVFSTLLVLVFLYACSSGPEKAAKNFTENLAKGKIEEAKKYATEPTGKLLDLASGFGTLPLNPNFKFIFIKDSVADNKAWVYYQDEKGDDELVELAKIDGTWKVHLQSQK